MEEFEGFHSVDGVWAVEVFDGDAITDSELVVEAANFCELVVDPFIESDSVTVAAFDHEGARCDEGCHLCVVGVSGEVPLPDFVFADEDVAHWHCDRCALANPFVEVSATDAETIAREHGRGAHGTLSAIAQAVKCDTLWVDVRLGGEPFKDTLVLAVDERVERESEWIEAALKGAEQVFSSVKVVGREGDEPAFCESEGEGFVNAPSVAGFIGVKQVFG